MAARTVVWIVGLVALVAGIAMAGIALWPLAGSITGGNATATQEALDEALGPFGIAAGVLLVGGAILMAAGERQTVKVEVKAEPSVKVRCASCGVLQPEGVSYCGSCGAPI